MKSKIAFIALFFLSNIFFYWEKYILLLLCPVYREVLYAESLPEVRDNLGDGVDHMGDFIADYELNVLNKVRRYLGC